LGEHQMTMTPVTSGLTFSATWAGTVSFYMTTIPHETTP